MLPGWFLYVPSGETLVLMLMLILGVYSEVLREFWYDLSEVGSGGLLLWKGAWAQASPYSQSSGRVWEVPRLDSQYAF